MTIVKEFPFRRREYASERAFDSENKPPRIIFGMKIKTFLIVALIVLLVVVGAAVGGAVGGKNITQGVSSPSRSYGQPTG